MEKSFTFASRQAPDRGTSPSYSTAAAPLRSAALQRSSAIAGTRT